MTRAFDLALQTPWAITQDALNQILTIAARAHEPDMLAAAKEYGERWAEILGDSQAITVHNGKPLDGTRRLVMRGNVAVLPIEGPMFRYANMFSAMSGATSLEMLANDLQVAASSDQVKAILLHIDSPGGQVNGTAEFADSIYRLRGQKPVVAYISNEGCSAAYWVASAADRIEVAPTAIIGSIGCIAGVGDPHPEPGRAIPFVSSQSPQKAPDPHTAAGNAALQGYVDDLAQEFINTVARNRGITADQVEQDFGQGGVFIGQKAVDAGLADSVSMFEDSLATLQKEVGSKKDTPSQPTDMPANEDLAPETAGPTAPAKRRSTVADKNILLRAIAAVVGSKDGEGEDPESNAEVARLLTEASTDSKKEEPVSPNPNPVAATPTPVAQAAQPERSVGADAEKETLRRQVASLEARNEQLLMAGITAQASEFAKQVIDVEHRGLPTMRAVVEQDYAQAAKDDLVLPPARIQIDGQMVSKSRVDLVRERYAAIPQNLLTTEQLQANLHTVLVNQATTKIDDPNAPASKERVAELVAMTSMGAAASANGKTSTNGSGR